MNPKSETRIRPFKRVKPGPLIDSLMSACPRVVSIPKVRARLRAAARQLAAVNIGFVNKGECVTALLQLEREAAFAADAVTSILGFILAPLQDEVEYGHLAEIAVPVEGTKPLGAVLWTSTLGDAVQRHFSCMAQIKLLYKTSPKYRKPGSSYCDDMLLSCSRTLVRPAYVRFARKLEEEFGWPAVEDSGLLKRVHLHPFEKQWEGQH
uniref:Uncharacterized protein n=1 Tax=viral metagenome TaxID=1070528 RepID=A0A6H1ZSY7_9ZZZZ